ncbi:hypothetical protein EON65_47485 [archaeon]|nr:MAG: hypothetical protein EON65_47485 [archaeon]
MISNDIYYLLRNPSVTSYAFKRRFVVSNNIFHVLDYAESKVYEVCKYDYDHNVVITISMGYPVTKFERHTSSKHADDRPEGLEKTLGEMGLRRDCVIWVAVTSPTDSKSSAK